MKKTFNKIFHQNLKTYLIIFIFILGVISLIFSNIIFYCFFTIAFMTLTLYKIRDLIIIDKLINKMNKEELKILKRELKSPIIESKYDYLALDSYIIKTGLNIGVLKYDDVVLVYKKYLYNFHTFNYTLVVVDKSNKKYKFIIDREFLPFKLSDLHLLEQIIYEKNKNILVGFTKENLDKIKNQYGFKVKNVFF